MSLLSKSKAKYIKSLQVKKSRIQERKFVVEGAKSVIEFLNSSYIIEEVVGTEEFYNEIDHDLLPKSVSVCNTKTLSSLGAFKSNNAALAIVRIPEITKLPTSDDQIILALDNINDPGNLGTIIRIADWYNIKYILINHSSVDIYNPKVVSASKGSLTRVNVLAHDLLNYFRDYKGDIYSAELSGIPINKVSNINKGIILMGSESHGVSTELEEYITQKITIPKKGGAESLNVAVATGIVCNQLLSS